MLSNESMSAVASSMGKQLLLEGRYVDLDKTVEKIDSITREMIVEAARLITNKSVTAVSVVGDAKNEEFYRNIIE